MKTGIAAVCCAGLAFLAMSLYLGTRGTESAPSTPPDSQRSAAQAQPTDGPARPKSASSRETDSEPPKAKRPATKPAQTVPNSTPARKPSAGMYFTAVRDKRGMPSRVTIHNTPEGNLTILLIGAGTSDGRYFMSKGTTSGAKKHKWEVQVSGGSITVLFDGQSVRPG